MSSNETTLKCKPKRYLWVDNLKMFACLLVVIGHLYMSMMAGGWISENNILYCWPIQTVYTFHVPLFFVCSGFLYQATAPNEWNVKKHIGNIKKKALALGVPYVTFSTITLLLKNVFATDVNNAAPPFLKTLLIEPIAPYWYLYTLFLLFCLIPPVIGKGKRKPLVSMVVIAWKIMKIKQLIKKSISQKTLFTDVFGYSLTKTGFADKYLAGQLTMYKSYSWLKKHFENDLKQIETELPKEQNCDVAEKQVWICWLQGMENAPQIVQDCYASVCYWMKDWKITVITADNMNEYVQFPDYIVRKWKEGRIHPAERCLQSAGR